MTQIKDFGEKNIAGDSDFLVLQSPVGETYKITVANLFARFSSGAATTANKILTFVASGDINGACYWLGSKFGGWSNPHTSGIIEASASSLQAGTLANLVDRNDGILMFSYNTPGSWMAINFKNYKLKPNYYSFRHDSEIGYYMRSWVMQGSNDAGQTWTDLDTRINDTTITGRDGWGSFPVAGINTFYKILRILSTGTDANGSNYFCIGEIEFYGELALV